MSCCRRAWLGVRRHRSKADRRQRNSGNCSDAWIHTQRQGQQEKSNGRELRSPLESAGRRVEHARSRAKHFWSHSCAVSLVGAALGQIQLFQCLANDCAPNRPLFQTSTKCKSSEANIVNVTRNSFTAFCDQCHCIWSKERSSKAITCHSKAVVYIQARLFPIESIKTSGDRDSLTHLKQSRRCELFAKLWLPCENNLH